MRAQGEGGGGAGSYSGDTQHLLGGGVHARGGGGAVSRLGVLGGYS